MLFKTRSHCGAGLAETGAAIEKLRWLPRQNGHRQHRSQKRLTIGETSHGNHPATACQGARCVRFQPTRHYPAHRETSCGQWIKF